MDKLLEEMFKRERWEKAIQIAVNKDMPHSELEIFCNPGTLAKLYKMIRDNEYSIIPPHQQAIPKDDGGTRIVYINENIDRIILSIIKDYISLDKWFREYTSEDSQQVLEQAVVQNKIAFWKIC